MPPLTNLILAQSDAATDEEAVDQATEGLTQLLDETCPNDGPVCEWVFDQTGNSTLANFLGEWIPILFAIALIFLAAVILSKVVRKLAHRVITKTATESRDALKAITRRTPNMQDALTVEERAAREARQVQRAETIAAVIGSVAVFTVYLIATFVALSKLGLDVGPLVAGAGVIGVALGFGAQSLVRDFLSGVFMILEDQYGVGDIVDTGEATGVVEAVTLRVTRLRDVEGTVWHVPNGTITRIGNFSQLWSRSLLDIGVAYETDLDHASTVITDVAEGMDADPEWADAILEPPELWGVQQFGPNEVVLRLVMKTQPAMQWAVNREFRARLKKAFDAEGIEIPFPQRTVWLKQDAAPAAGVPEAALQPSGDVNGQS